MKVHRYYMGNTPLTHAMWVDDPVLFHQWTKVLRYEQGRELILFNQQHEERLYQIERYGNDAAHLILVTELEPKLPHREVYVCLALLKKDKYEWVLQKGTELGIRHFIPLVTERTEKLGFDMNRAQKIVVEAAEQCGRSDIPSVREPIGIAAALSELVPKMTVLIAEQQGEQQPLQQDIGPIAIMIGPEGGWSDNEKQLFEAAHLQHVAVGNFTLRAETAAIAAATLLQ